MTDTNPLQQRTTSAGYRLPLPSRPRSSEFHQTCIPQESRKAAAVSQGSGADGKPTFDPVKDDVVTQDKIWKQAVDTEKRGVKQWKENWGFLTEFDPKGRPVTPKSLPENPTTFSENVPNTNAGNYGSRLNSDIGQTMQRLEFQFNSHNRKKKIGNDLICY